MTYALHIYNKKGKKKTIETLLVGSDSENFWKAVGNELRRLANKINIRVRETDTIGLNRKGEVPRSCMVTYAIFVSDHLSLKSELSRVIITVCGDRLEYTEDVSSPAAYILESKLLFNSLISYTHRGARFLLCDLEDVFIGKSNFKSIIYYDPL